MKNLTDWLNDYNKCNPSPEEILSPSCESELLKLCIFVTETRAHNGEKYPPKTLYSLLSGILRTENPSYPNFLDKENPVFSTFRITVDNLFKVLRSSGVGATSSHTEGISNEEEETLWNSGVFNTNTPLGLLRAVFYYNGKCFCLRGGQEHRELGISQLTRHQKPDRYVYNENSSKNRKGGLAEMRLEHKSVSYVCEP